MDINTKIKMRIKQLLEERNWSANHLAEVADISAASITNWHKRNTTPSLEAIIKICDAFGIAVSEFFNESSKPVELTKTQQELLSEWNLLHKQQKEDFLTMIKNTNTIIKKLDRPI